MTKSADFEKVRKLSKLVAYLRWVDERLELLWATIAEWRESGMLDEYWNNYWLRERQEMNQDIAKFYRNQGSVDKGILDSSIDDELAYISALKARTAKNWAVLLEKTHPRNTQSKQQ